MALTDSSTASQLKTITAFLVHDSVDWPSGQGSTGCCCFWSLLGCSLHLQPTARPAGGCWSGMGSARTASPLPRVSSPSVGSPRLVHVAPPRLVHVAPGQGSQVKAKGHKTSGSSAQNWPKATSNTSSCPKQATTPAKMQRVGKSTAPLCGRSHKVTLQRGEELSGREIAIDIL